MRVLQLPVCAHAKTTETLVCVHAVIGGLSVHAHEVPNY
jgi:hypothetical protein